LPFKMHFFCLLKVICLQILAKTLQLWTLTEWCWDTFWNQWILLPDFLYKCNSVFFTVFWNFINGRRKQTVDRSIVSTVSHTHSDVIIVKLKKLNYWKLLMCSFFFNWSGNNTVISYGILEQSNSCPSVSGIVF